VKDDTIPTLALLLLAAALVLLIGFWYSGFRFR
jgi:hypothetical protein